MDCLNCPLIQDEIEQRLDVYGYEEITRYPDSEEDILDEICRSCFCDKFDSKIFMTNPAGCEDYHEKSSTFTLKKEIGKSKRKSRREYEEKHKKHLEDLSHLPGYPPGAWKKNKTYIYGSENAYIECSSPFYFRLYKGRRYTNFKKMANRKVRRTTKELFKGNTYRKVFDLWWEYC